MEFNRVRALRGPNVWSRAPVLEVEIDFGRPAHPLSSAFPGFAERLAALLPTEAAGPDDGKFVDAVRRGTPLADVLLHLALRLQALAGSPPLSGRVRQPDGDGPVQLVVEYEEEKLSGACLEAAREVCAAAMYGQPYDTMAAVERVRSVAHEVRLGPSTGAIARAAGQRHIPTRRLGEGSLVLLGWGSRQRRILAAETDRTGAIAQHVAQDKHLTRELLEAVGVPVPRGRPVRDAEDAWRAAEEVGLPVVVKPQYGSQGRGVTTNLTTRAQVERGYAAALEESPYVMVEHFVAGADYRLLVVGDRVVAASRREPAQVAGDGHSTVAQLVAEANKDPRRSDGHATSLSWIKLDSVGLAVLAEQGYTADSVPPAGTRVLIRRNGNLSTGGTATDVTDQVHPDVAARAVEAAQVVGLDIAGVDVVALDLARPLEAQGGTVVEVNAGPGLRMHLDPSAGTPRAVGEAIVEMLFPPGETGRIPVVAVTGVNGKTTTSRLLAHLLRTAGRLVGLACTDGTYIDGRRTDAGDGAGPHGARAVLLNPRVEAAVLETERGGILREGLGFDRCDVAVVTNLGRGDAGGPAARRTVVEAVAPTGCAVLNADDPPVAGMATHCPGEVLYFGKDPGSLLLKRHRAADGRAVLVRDGVIVLSRAGHDDTLAGLSEVPFTHGGTVAFQVGNALAAVTAAWALGLSPEGIRAGLLSFTGDSRQAPGRFNVFRARGATVIVDHPHKLDALAALVAALDHFPSDKRSFVFSGRNRPDQDLPAMGEVIGRAFDRVILYPKRAEEANRALHRGMTAGGRATELSVMEGEAAALELALSDLRAGALVVLAVESVEALALVLPRLNLGTPTHSGAGLL